MACIYGNYDNNTFLDFYNVDYSLENFENIFRESLYGQESLSIVPVRICNLKHYNYVLGYEYGDIIIKNVFEKIESRVKGKGSICRLGGDTLLIILNDICRSRVSFIAEEIIRDFKNPIEIKEKKLRILLNIGVVQYPKDSKEIQTIFKYTEIVLDNLKKRCKYGYEFFTNKMVENHDKRWQYEKDILSAIDNNEFKVYYQPVVDISNNSICGFEALLRWQHPKDGLVMPLEFIDILESSGAIIEVGKFVFKEVCNEIKNINRLSNKNMKVGINICKNQLEDDAFLEFIEKTLRETEVDGKYIDIEITERVIVEPTEKIVHTLNELKKMGIGILIDDFGTKYSSLNYLCNLPISGLKIDRSFIEKIPKFHKEFIVIKNIIQLARELDLEVVAEGVETKEQVDFLLKLNCSKVQGFIFGKPFPRENFQKVLSEKSYIHNELRVNM